MELYTHLPSETNLINYADFWNGCNKLQAHDIMNTVFFYNIS